MSTAESNFATITERRRPSSTYSEFLFRKLVGKLVWLAETRLGIVRAAATNFENWPREQLPIYTTGRPHALVASLPRKPNEGNAFFTSLISHENPNICFLDVCKFRIIP